VSLRVTGGPRSKGRVEENTHDRGGAEKKEESRREISMRVRPPGGVVR
jgi:hypothetical protein